MRTSTEFITVLMAGCLSLLCVAGGKEDYGTQTWNEIPAKRVSRRPTKSVKIDCHYPEIHEENEKFLCKGQSPHDCVELIHTTKEDNHLSKGRLRIRDNQRKKYFWVYISKLTTEDSGTYWCGSDRTWQQTEFNKTLLTVEDKDLPSSLQDDEEEEEEEEEPLDDQDEDKSDKNESNAGKSGLIGGMAAALVLILILMVGLLLIRFKPFKTPACWAARGSSEQAPNTDQNTQGDHGEHFYDEIQDQQGSSGGKLQMVYATVKPPTEEIHYTSINVHAGSADVSRGGDAPPDQIKNGSSACVYSTVVTHGPPHPLEEE